MGPSLVGAAANGHGGIYRGLAFAGVSFFVSATLLLRLPQKSDKLRLARAYRRGLWRFDPGAPRIGTCGQQTQRCRGRMGQMQRARHIPGGPSYWPRTGGALTRISRAP